MRGVEVEVCIVNNNPWLSSNSLKLNDDKTVVLVHTKMAIENVSGVRIGNATIHSSELANNLGVSFNKTLDLEGEINAVCISELSGNSWIRCNASSTVWHG